MSGARHRSGSPLTHSNCLLLPRILSGRRRRRIGLLGGSFNPAHRGHRHISLEALTRLDLDEIWWLVSPQNPLKSTEDMAGFAERFASACAVAAGHPKIHVTDIETRLKTRFTADTLKILHRRFPASQFVWLMGADNLAQIPRWQNWATIFRTTPIAVFARPTYSLASLRGIASTRFKRARLTGRRTRRLAATPAPAWTFFPIPLDPLSATDIRRRRKRAKND